uniref:Uncharacterized protein n=1 Tax=Knipowitschia caucasica TaxID=637954 RepID=A0AAV2MTK0_KNICA
MSPGHLLHTQSRTVWIWAGVPAPDEVTPRGPHAHSTYLGCTGGEGGGSLAPNKHPAVSQGHPQDRPESLSKRSVRRGLQPTHGEGAADSDRLHCLSSRCSPHTL